MDYSRLISDAWRITWRHKYLWVLGLFAAGGGGCSGTANFNTSSFQLPGSDQDPIGIMSDLELWVQDHWALLGALLVGLIAVGFVLFVISVMATAGLVAGVDDAAARRPGARLGTAWRRGGACFWRLLGMWLLVGLVVVVVMVVMIAIVVVPIAVSASNNGSVGGLGVVAAILIGIVMLFALIPAAAVLNIVLEWGARAVVLENTGVTASLSRGWRVFRANIGPSLLVWIIGIVLSFGAGIALAVVAFAAAIPAGVLVATSWGDIGPTVIAALGLLGLVVLVVMLAVKAVWATYFSAYWTLAFRQLTAPRIPAIAPAGPGYYPPAGNPWEPPPPVQQWAAPPPYAQPPTGAPSGQQPYEQPPYPQDPPTSPAPPE